MLLLLKNDIFSIGPVTVHGYGLMIGIGFILCVLLGVYRAKKRGMSSDAAIDIALLGVIIGFIGAKLMYVIVELPAFIKNPLDVLGSEGFVVYGGIIAGVAAAMVYCKRKKLVFLDYFDLLAPSISIAQAFGRIGCFMAGCCYGKETSSVFSVTFPEGSIAPAGVALIPTQLIFAAGNFVIMIALLVFSRRSKHRGDVGALYLLLYGVGRFALEFLRADNRGTVGVLSTSQFISIFFVLGAALMFYMNRRRDAKAPIDAPVEEVPAESEPETDSKPVAEAEVEADTEAPTENE